MSFLVKELSIEVINLIFADYCTIEDILRFDNAMTNYRLRKAYVRLLPILKLPLDLIRFSKTQLRWVSARKISITILKIAKGARAMPAEILSEMKCPTLTDVNLSHVNHVVCSACRYQTPFQSGYCNVFYIHKHVCVCFVVCPHRGT